MPNEKKPELEGEGNYSGAQKYDEEAELEELELDTSLTSLGDGRDGVVEYVAIAGGAQEAQPRGFLLVNTFMQSVRHAEVFRVGDCATVGGHAMPKAGVVATSCSLGPNS